MEQKGVGTWICNSLNIDNQNVQTINVNEYNFEQIEPQLNNLQFNDNDQIIVNITGGTKVMTLAIYEHLRQLGAQILYVVPNSNQ